jgi:hypothetical protein
MTIKNFQKILSLFLVIKTKHNVYNQTTKSNYLAKLFIVNSLFYVKGVNNG